MIVIVVSLRHCSRHTHTLSLSLYKSVPRPLCPTNAKQTNKNIRNTNYDNRCKLMHGCHAHIADQEKLNPVIFDLQQACKMRWSGQWPQGATDANSSSVIGHMLGVEDIHLDPSHTGKYSPRGRVWPYNVGRILRSASIFVNRLIA